MPPTVRDGTSPLAGIMAIGRRVAGKASRVAAKPLEDPERRKRIPSTSERFGPPRHHASFGRMQAHPDVEVRMVTGPEPLVAPVWTWHGPAGTSGPTERHGSGERPPLPPLGVATVKGARVVLPHGWAIGPEDHLLTDALFGWDEPTTHWVNRVRRARPGRTLPGRTISLLSDYAVGDWTHFLCDALSRIHLLELAHIDLAAADRVLVPALDSATARWAVERALPGATIEWVAPSHEWPTVACEELVVTSFPGALGRYPAWVGAWLRDLVPDEVRAEPAGAPLFVAGGPEADNRVLRDEAQLAGALEVRGFTVIRPGHGGIDDVRAFHAAPVVVAAHGAALANLPFCRPGTTLVELVPPGFEVAYYGSLAAALGITHHVVAGRTPTGAPAGDPSTAPFSVDLDRVLGIVEAVQR
jgi:capsular polysaccharide biosynthesis protein